MKLISCLPFIGLISALYQDQVGKVDWKLDVLGLPKLVSFDDANAQADAIAIYTEQNILASVSAVDGSVSFSRIYSALIMFSRFSGNERCRFLRMWNTSTTRTN